MARKKTLEELNNIINKTYEEKKALEKAIRIEQTESFKKDFLNRYFVRKRSYEQTDTANKKKRYHYLEYFKTEEVTEGFMGVQIIGTLFSVSPAPQRKVVDYPNFSIHYISMLGEFIDNLEGKKTNITLFKKISLVEYAKAREHFLEVVKKSL